MHHLRQHQVGRIGSVSSTYDEVKQRYEAIYDATTGTAMKDGVGLVELLLSMNAGNGMAIQAALQQPWSYGRLYINSASVYDKPFINPQCFTHPGDITILRQGVKLARAMGGSAHLSNSLQAKPHRARTSPHQIRQLQYQKKLRAPPTSHWCTQHGCMIQAKEHPAWASGTAQFFFRWMILHPGICNPGPSAIL
ncbi:hypothetical protein CPC08DRAFT_726369 [Agrocybe pediades]|nr:hypothetical protein CPC08DRAFT_726369 [Agrocybe pediades]